MSPPVRMLVARCPDWPVTAAGVPPEVPAAVFHANRVVAASPAARAEGVATGHRRREAQRRCPELAVIDHDSGRDAAAFEVVAAALETLTPRLELLRPGVAAFATRGPSRYFGGDHALAARAAAVVDTALGRPGSCQVGIADGVFAAGLAARVGMVVAPGAGPEFLAPLPVSALDRPELADLLRRLGLRTLGDFAAVGEGHVVGRFGAAGALAHRLARGLDERPPHTRTPPPDLVVAAELDPPAERVDQAAFVAKSLADQLHEQLAARGLACLCVAVEAETEHGEVLVRRWRHEGALTAAGVVERVRWQLDGWLAGSATTRPSGGLALLRLVPEQVVPHDGRQLGFWGSDAAVAERASRALARVQGLLGPHAVTQPRLRGGRSPAERVVCQPLFPADLADGPGGAGGLADAGGPGGAGGAGGDEAAGGSRSGPWPGQIPAPAPAVVLDPPAPAEVLDGAGQPVAVSGRGQISAGPAQLSIDGDRWTEVVGWAGPWPAEERWWDPAAHRRRARCQVLTADGRAHLLALEGGRWWVEATYD